LIEILLLLLIHPNYLTIVTHTDKDSSTFGISKCTKLGCKLIIAIKSHFEL
jgi:hypothetical protein